MRSPTNLAPAVVGRRDAIAVTGQMPVLRRVTDAQVRAVHRQPVAEDVEPTFAALVGMLGASWLEVPAPGPRLIEPLTGTTLPRTGPILLATITELPE